VVAFFSEITHNLFHLKSIEAKIKNQLQEIDQKKEESIIKLSPLFYDFLPIVGYIKHNLCPIIQGSLSHSEQQSLDPSPLSLHQGPC
jgi:hypothetical protein